MGHRIAIIAGALVFTFSLVDCAGCGRGGEARIEARTTTLGQELKDLKEAHDAGIISDKEYEKKKDELMDD
jgi:hypothetical protein